MSLLKKVLLYPMAIVLFCCPLASAAIPPGDNIGAQSERFQADTKARKDFLEAKKVKKPKVEVEEPEKKKEQPSGVQFHLREVILQGATLFPAKELAPFYQPLLNQSVRFDDLNAAAQRIKAYYFSKGYWTTLAFIPAQDVKDGKVTIQVAEGKMGELKIEGNKWFPKRLIRRYVHVKSGELLNMDRLQKGIQTLDENSDIEIKAVIDKGEKPQTSDVILKVKDRFPWHLGVSTDNAGTRLTGKSRTSLSLRSSNVLGLNDSLFSNTMITSRSFGQAVNYEIPVNTYGTTVGFNYSYFAMSLGKEYKAADIKGYSNTYTPYLSQALFTNESYQASVNAGLQIKCIKRSQDLVQTSDDQLRLPYLGFDLSALDRFRGQTSFSPQISFGTQDFLGASARDHPSASRAGTGGFFANYTQSLKRIQAMPLKTYLVLKSQFQVPSHTLPSSEQFQLGGINSVRGYPEGDYSADIGASFNADWVCPLTFLPEKWQVPYAGSIGKLIDVVAFTDLGGGKLKKVLPGELHDKFLMGVGGGFRIHLGNNLYLRLEWAQAIGDRPTGGSGPANFHFGVQSEV
jgi:hemolysin activation/secretion protein